MQALFKPLLRPLPLLGLSTGSIILTGLLSTSSRPAAMASTAKNWPVEPYTPRSNSWPYKPVDFSRQDPSPDANFYSDPRFVTHIDDAAIASLRHYYDTVLPRKGRLLDFCSSWLSHYPRSVEQAAATGELKVIGMGMNKAELDANSCFNSGRLLVDLNETPDIASALASDQTGREAHEQSKLDVSTCVVSIDYLTEPVAVLASLREATRPGGTVHLAVSNRCFPTKAISRWLRIGEAERLLMVGDYLHFAGWEKIEIVELSDGKLEQGELERQPQGGLQGLMGWMGMNARDPIWVVRAVKG